MNVLFLFESVLPKTFHSETVSPGELRVIAAQNAVKQVWALGPWGASFYDVSLSKTTKTFLERKIELIRFSWSRTAIAYYFTWVALLWYGVSLCKRHHIDVIHAESPHISGIAAIILGIIFHTKVIIEYRVSYNQLLINRYGLFLGLTLQKIFWLIAKSVMNKADFVAPNSQLYVDELVEILNHDRIDFYNSGVRVPKNFRSHKHNGFVVGFLGRMYSDKGPEQVLKLARQHQGWFRDNRVRFLMAGDGPMLASLQLLCSQEGIEDIVKLKGTMNRWKFFKQIDVMINTTMIRPALELSIAEAALVRIPCISYGELGFPETIKHGVSGIIIPIGDIDEMFRQLKKLITNKVVWRAYGIQAKLFGFRFSYQNQVKRLMKIYEQ